MLGALLEAASVPHSNPNPNPNPDPNPTPNPNPNPNPSQAASVLPDCPLSGGTLDPNPNPNPNPNPSPNPNPNANPNANPDPSLHCPSGWQPCTSRVGLLIAGRILSGIASGGVCVVAPTYLGEIAPAYMRGTLGTLSQLTTALGVLAGQLLGFPAGLGSVGAWPLMLGLTLLPAMLQLLLQPMLWESPRWYALLGNERMAEQQLVSLRDRPQHEAELQATRGSKGG